MTVQLRAVDHDNFYQVLELKRPEDEAFVAPNVLSLAEAWLYRDAGRVDPRAIYADRDLVGFLMTYAKEGSRVLDLWRLLIPEKFVNRGYGTAALRLLVEEAAGSGSYDRIRLSYVPGNDLAEHVYQKVGFRSTGEIEDGEVVMAMELDGRSTD